MSASSPAPGRLRLGLAQIKTTLGSPRANLEKHLSIIENARKQNIELLCFPELSLTGYVLQDLVSQTATPAGPESPLFEPLLDASWKLDLVVGYVEEDERHRYRIASAYLSGGKVVHVHHKVYLPTYGMFDEGRFLAQGERVRAFDTRWGRMGILICEDFWHASPPYLLWLDGAEVLLHCSSSPGRGLDNNPRLASNRWVDHVNQAYAGLFTVFVAHVNRVGFEDGLNFWGGSTVFDPDGELVSQAETFEETLLCTDLDLGRLQRTRARLPLLRDERPELALRELERLRSQWMH